MKPYSEEKNKPEPPTAEERARLDKEMDERVAKFFEENKEERKELLRQSVDKFLKSHGY